MSTTTSRTDEHPGIGLRLEVDLDHTGWLVFDMSDSPVNLLSSDVLRRLDTLLGEIESRVANGRLLALVLRSGKEGTFIAGADVREIRGVESAAAGRAASAEGHRIFRRLQRLRVPTIAAIDGVCLGGGTEMALHCDLRVASDREATRIGQPEVRLGIIPGFGGCVQLPRRIGIQAALRMILGSRPVGADKALRMGLVDRVVPAARFEEELRRAVSDAVAGRLEPSERRPGLRDRLLEGTAPGRAILFHQARKRAEREAKGFYPAPLRAIEVIRAGVTAPLDEAYEIEARALGDLVVTPVARNLVRVFLLQQEAKRVLSGEARSAAGHVRRAAVVGAGVMGGSIAELIAAGDLPVALKDIDQGALDSGLHHAAELLRKGARAGAFSETEAGLKLARITGTLAYEELRDADLVIEAVVEKLAVKRQVFRELEATVAADAVLATNTSALSVTAMADGLERPGRVVGLHFFNPVHRMPLVEVVRAERTSPRALATAFDLAVRLGKTPIVVEDRPGFLVNRLLGPYLNEAGRLLEEGTGIRELDAALVAFGMPMGPCRLLDEIGFDVALHAGHEMADGLGERLSPPDVLQRMVDDGRLGRKNGRGFYAYEDGRERGPAPEADALFPRREDGPDDEACRRRCLWLMVNEACHALENRVVASAGLLDLAMILGTGFPPFRGGLLRWADGIGAAELLEGLGKLEAAHGPRFAPAPLLRRAAERGNGLSDSS